MARLIERPQYMDWLRRLRDRHLIKVVTGVRRCGKSTLLEMFADELRVQGVVDEQIQFYNFEDPDVYAIGDWKQVYDHIKIRLLPDRMNYIFLDEVQNVDVFERLVDGLFIKKNCDVYITGSNAYFLSGELATLLTGRYLEIEMYPYSFKEYASFISANAAKINGTGSPQKLTKSESFADYLYYGGIPEVQNLLISDTRASDEFAAALFQTILRKDIYSRHQVVNQPAFEKVIDYLFDAIGSPVSANKIKNSLVSAGVKVDNETVSNYLAYLAEVLLVYRVPRYEVKGKGLLQTQDKFYVVDPSFRRVRLGRAYGIDTGHLLENAVYYELLRRNNRVYVGKYRDSEVDFLVEDTSGYISYYQVAYQAMDAAVLERELAPLRAIKDSNQKYLLTMDQDIDPVFDGIRKLNVIRWLLD